MSARYKLLAAAVLSALLAAAFRLFFQDPRDGTHGHADAETTVTVTVGTFNVENFTMKDPDDRGYYTPQDAAEIARTILASGADVLALQEIEGETTMRRFIRELPPCWKYIGNDTAGSQDLYFLWNSNRLERTGWLLSYDGNKSYSFAGRLAKRFDRLPLKITFREKTSGRKFSMINVHLKSKLVFARENVEFAQRRNTAKRGAQMESLNRICQRLSGDGPLFILGDFNDDLSQPDGRGKLAFPVFFLRDGFSYDNMRNNLDYIGCLGLDDDRLGPVRETETRIARRSVREKEHPDHDIITVEVRLP